jgi:hypothetical protein
MIARPWKFAAAAAAVALVTIAGCKTNQTAPASAGETTAASPSGTSGGSGIPTLVNVDLHNILNNLSVALKIANTNIPVNAQVPVAVAANVCGVSVNALAAAAANGMAHCTATTASPQLIQYVSQQISAGGGTQTNGSTTNNMM